MAGFLFKLETADGAAAEPSTLSSAVPDADQPPVLVVEER
jgi:hypothetical protein